jgi:hypothetical protein
LERALGLRGQPDGAAKDDGFTVLVDDHQLRCYLRLRQRQGMIAPLLAAEDHRGDGSPARRHLLGAPSSRGPDPVAPPTPGCRRRDVCSSSCLLPPPRLGLPCHRLFFAFRQFVVFGARSCWWLVCHYSDPRSRSRRARDSSSARNSRMRWSSPSYSFASASQ